MRFDEELWHRPSGSVTVGIQPKYWMHASLAAIYAQTNNW